MFLSESRKRIVQRAKGDPGTESGMTMCGRDDNVRAGMTMSGARIPIANNPSGFFACFRTSLL